MCVTPFEIAMNIGLLHDLKSKESVNQNHKFSLKADLQQIAWIVVRNHQKSVIALSRDNDHIILFLAPLCMFPF